MTVALVTGGGGALGGAVVAALQARGDTVVAADRDERALAALPAGVLGEVADLGDPASVEALFDRVTAAHGPPDALVHAVGMYGAGSVADSEVDDYRLLMSVNLDVAWWVSRAAARAMRGRGGAILHVGARQGVEASSGAAAYSLTKAAVVHLTRVLDAELRATGCGSTRSCRD